MEPVRMSVSGSQPGRPEYDRMKFFVSAAISVAVFATVRRAAIYQLLGRSSMNSSLAMVAAPAVPLAFLPNINHLLSFWFGEFIMWSPVAKVLSLLVVCAAFAKLGGYLFAMVDQEGEVDSPVWRAIRAIVNPFEDDFATVPTRVVSCFLASIGMVFFGILVGMVTQTVEDAVNSFPNMRIPAIVSNHVVVNGWNSSAPLALSRVVGNGSKVAVITNHPPDEVIAAVRDKLGSDRGGKVYVRLGNPLVKFDLERVRAMDAKTIVFLSDSSYRENPDSKDVVSKTLAFRGSSSDFQGNLVAVVNDQKDEAIVESILNGTLAKSVQIVNANKLLGRYLAQVVVQRGLNSVVREMMTAESATKLDFVEAKSGKGLVDELYSNIDRYDSLPGRTILGYVGSDGQVHISAKDDFKITSATKLLVIGDGSTRRTEGVSASGFSVRPTETPENVLICGWRRNMTDMLTELDETLPPKSKIVVLGLDKQLTSLPKKLSKSSITQIQGRWVVPENLEKAFNSAPINKVIVLASQQGADAEDEDSDLRADANSLAGLAHIESLVKANGSKVDLSAEFWDERMHDVADHFGYANVIYPYEVGSRLIAETLREPLLNQVWNELLSQYGREVTMRPVTKYLGEDKTGSYQSIAKAASEDHNEIVIGYANGKSAFLNPSGTDKTANRTWSEDDIIVTLSEN
ncbi:hypothetical protein NDN08_002886 [Rhodosorus marinus]|uniref:Uncharacterized protein n=1 Tax=Rhodosorus marinus TaxID=101924 RepID=A0AAV8UV05_9RHOD|nr:hypothetical protein NDN08_002886 [Rhodosorus marinus]